MLAIERLGEGGVVERGLDGVLAVVEVAPDAEHADVGATLGHHLPSLEVGDAVCGIEDDDVGVFAVCKALQRGLAGVPDVATRIR
jgi:hypothetical protein